jgi:lipopolysaccharide/colanic/teichoic acid biosynthesis glycosyltransferase
MQELNVPDVTERSGTAGDLTRGKGVPRWKRVLDVTAIAVTAPGWVLLGLLVAAWIKLVSRGPVFFRQPRIGYLGRPFLCLKFRSMAQNADDSVHQAYLVRLISSDRPMTKLDAKGDSRLIPGGRLLRALGLDELPQLLNVLRGDMSLVGPRPCLPYEYEHYLPRHRRRCETVPGLTGLWQISGKNNTTFEEMIELDVAYVEKQSLLLDLKIILWTAPAIVQQVLERPKAARRANLRRSTTDLKPL